MPIVDCATCKVQFNISTGHFNRGGGSNGKFFCDKNCFGLSRRKGKTKEQRIAEKREYDKQYREKNLAEIKKKKAAYYANNHDREKEREIRKKRMPLHVEYCRRHEYKAKKKEYDRELRFRAFGPFADAAKLLDELETEISKRATRYEIYVANGRFTRSATKRRRELWQQMKRH